MKEDRKETNKTQMKNKERNETRIPIDMSESVSELFPALFAAKKELGPVTKKSDNPFYKSSYADLNEHLDTVEPILEKYGLFLLQPPCANDSGNYVVTMIVHAKSGQWISGMIKVPSSITDSQKIGAAITYFRRFGINSLLSLKSEDDDGNTVTGKNKKKNKSNKKYYSNDDY